MGIFHPHTIEYNCWAYKPFECNDIKKSTCLFDNVISNRSQKKC